MTERPLSPHLDVYRWGYTMSLSILHRLTGMALAVTLIGFVGWLFALSQGRDVYDGVAPLLNSLPARLVVALALLALIYHFFAGLRHLAWDLGLGFERAQARRSALLVLAATLLIGLLTLFLLWHDRGGAA